MTTTSPTRMTGITGLLDTDALVSASMLPYKTKVNTKKQDKQIMQWKQQQYRQVMKDSKGFYDKYLDPTGSNSLSLLSKYTTAKFASSNENAVTATASNGAVVDNYTVSVTQLASKATASLADTVSGDQTIKIGTSTMTFTAAANDGATTIANYNTAVSNEKTRLNNLVTAGTASNDDKTQLAYLNSNTVNATYNSFSKSVVFTAAQMGQGGYNTDVNKTPKASFALNGADAKDKQASATITNSDNQAITYTGNSNATTIDGTTFNFKATGSVSLTGTTDITDIKKNIVSFVNDYNTLMSSINTKIYETYDKSYKPLTDDQKKDMKDTDITNWQTKAQTGLLRNDDNLEELASSMKDAMSTFISSTGLSLEKIGIKPVEDYADKNGTLTIDDAKLTTALEQNFDGVKDLFTNGILTSDTTNGGVITKLKSSIYSNTMASTANLVQKAGSDTGLSSLTNEMTLQLNDMTKNITEMESSLTDRENTLYTKYASIESTLSKLQAQQSSLDSYFTSGS